MFLSNVQLHLEAPRLQRFVSLLSMFLAILPGNKCDNDRHVEHFTYGIANMSAEYWEVNSGGPVGSLGSFQSFYSVYFLV